MTTEHPPGTQRTKRSRLRERSLLLNPIPVVAASLAAFALAFGGMTARLVAGRDPALGVLASSGPGTTSGSGAAVTTRASAATTSGTTPASAPGTAIAKPRTATSGAAASGGGSSPLSAGDA